MYLNHKAAYVIGRPVARSENPEGGGARSTAVGIICPPG